MVGGTGGGQAPIVRGTGPGGYRSSGILVVGGTGRGGYRSSGSSLRETGEDQEGPRPLTPGSPAPKTGEATKVRK